LRTWADCFHGIAGYYWDLADYDKAIGYYIRARGVYKSFDTLGYVNEQQVIGSLYLEWGNLDKAEVFLKSALKDLTRLKGNLFYCNYQLGNLFFESKITKRQYIITLRRNYTLQRLP